MHSSDLPSLCGWPIGGLPDIYLPKPCYNPTALILPTVIPIPNMAKDMLLGSDVSIPPDSKRCSAFSPYSKPKKVARKMDFVSIGIKREYVRKTRELKQESVLSALLSSKAINSPAAPHEGPLPLVSAGPHTPVKSESDYERRKSDFLRTWNSVAKQIPSKEEIQRQNPHWDREKVELYEKFKNPHKLFDLAEDVDAMNRVFALFRDSPMSQIPEEPDEDLTSTSED